MLDAGWKHYFLELKDTDIRGPDREIYETSEGRFQQSWIWTMTRTPRDSSNSISSDPQPSVAGPAPPHQQPVSSASAVISGDGPGSSTVDEKELHQSHRAHWARAQARAERYEEELKLTVEEMGRTLQFFKWKSSSWRSISSERSKSGNPPPPDVQSGLRAYADRQSHTYDSLITLFVSHWRGFLLAHSLGSSWLHNYPLGAHPVPPARPRRGHRGSDADLPTTDAPRKPKVTNPISGGGTTSQSASQPETSSLTPDDAADAPLDSGSSDESSDGDFTDGDSWGEDSADDD